MYLFQLVKNQQEENLLNLIKIENFTLLQKREREQQDSFKNAMNGIEFSLECRVAGEGEVALLREEKIKEM